METLFRNYYRLLENTDTTYYRYLFSQIAWENRLISILGARGTGKTTMMLQYIKTRISDKGKALYVSLDNIWFSENKLIELVEYFYTHGGRYLFLDEVHRYPNWAVEIKNIYDSYPALHIVFTGSSMLKINQANADLSRRSINYRMAGLSFREYLEFENIGNFPVFSLEEILKNHISIAREIISKMTILPLFSDYLQNGFYPFYKEDKDTYFIRLQNVVDAVIYNDLQSIFNIEYATLLKIKKLLKIMSSMVPYTPNITALSQQIESNRATTIKFLNYLQQGGILMLLSSPEHALKSLEKPDKVYLNNTNLLYSLNTIVNIGNARETFFANQIDATQTLNISKEGDFLVNDQHIFEIGGKSKTYRQIKNIPDSYVVSDDIEIGFGNKIPLWLFGFLY